MKIKDQNHLNAIRAMDTKSFQAEYVKNTLHSIDSMLATKRTFREVTNNPITSTLKINQQYENHNFKICKKKHN